MLRNSESKDFDINISPHVYIDRGNFSRFTLSDLTQAHAARQFSGKDFALVSSQTIR